MDRRFYELLTKALAGDCNAIEEVLKLYMPLIEHHNRIYGYIDEDCKQYIIIRVIVGISKFTVCFDDGEDS